MNVNNRFKTVFLVFILPLLIRAQALPDVIAKVLTADHRIKAASENVFAQKAAYKSTFAGTLPRLQFDASYRYVSEVAEINFSRLNLPGPLPSFQLGTHNTYDSGISMDYVLFSGFAQQSALELADGQLQLAQNSLEQQQEKSAFQTIRLYRNAQRLMLEKKTLTNARARAGLQLKRLRSLLQNGFARPVDTLTVRLAVLRIDQKSIALETARKNVLEQLRNLVGEDVRPLPFKDTPAALPLKDIAIEQHPYMRALQVQDALLGSKKQLARSAYYPRIAVQGAYKYGKPGVDPIQDKWMTYGVAGIGISWNLWHWGADKQKIAVADHQQQALRNRESALRKDLNTRYKNAYREWQSMNDELRVIEAANRLAKLKWQIVSKQFAEGAATADDLNDANLALSDSEIDVQRKKIEMSIKRSELDYLSGLPVKAWSLQ